MKHSSASSCSSLASQCASSALRWALSQALLASFRSRGVIPVLAPNPATDEEAFVALVAEVAAALGRPGVLFPTHDAHMRAVVAHAERVLPLAMPGSGWDVVEPLMAKRPQIEAARAAGVPVPPTWAAAARAEAEQAAREVAYPAIVKPSLGIAYKAATHQQVVQADGPAELLAGWEAIVATGDEALVQEIVPGGDDCLWTVGAFSTDGGQRVRGVFCGRKLVQEPPIFGTCRIGEARWSDEAVRLGEALLAATGFDGITQIEFKRDPRDGSFRLIEINLRTWQWHSLARLCGVDLVRMCSRPATADDVSEARSRPPPDCRRWGPAIPHLQFSRRNGEPLGASLRPLLGRVEEPILSLRAPKPGAYQLAGLVVGPVKRRLRRR